MAMWTYFRWCDVLHFSVCPLYESRHGAGVLVTIQSARPKYETCTGGGWVDPFEPQIRLEEGGLLDLWFEDIRVKSEGRDAPRSDFGFVMPVPRKNGMR